MAEKLSFVVSDPVGLHARVMSLGVPTKATVEIIAEGDKKKDVIVSIAKVIKEQKVAE